MVPLAITNGAIPSIPQPSRLGLMALLRLAPVGILGCLIIGLANSAFWTFGPLFARNEIGGGAPVSLFMATCVLGGAMLQWPIGRISDGRDRRWVMLLLCIASAAVAVALALLPQRTDYQTYGLGFAFGAASLTLYSLCVAYANDRADPSGYVDVSSYLLLVFGIGAIAGPTLAGTVITSFGYPSLFLFTASAELTLAGIVLFSLWSKAAVPSAQTATFVSQPPISHGTQAIIELQPMDEAPTPERKERSEESE